MRRGGGIVTEQQSNFGMHIDEPNVASNGTVTQNIIIGDKDILSLSLDANEQVGSSGLIFERDSRSDGHCFDSLCYQYKCKLLNVPYTNHPNTDWVFNNRFDISSSTFDIIFDSSSSQVGQHTISVFAENDLIDTDKSSLNLYVGSTTIDGITSTAGISMQVDDEAEDKQAKLTFTQANSKDNEVISVTLDQLALKSDIPSELDLTNYQGYFSLSNQQEIDNATYTTQFTNNPIAIKNVTLDAIQINATVSVDNNVAFRQGFISAPSLGIYNYVFIGGLTFEEYLEGIPANKYTQIEAFTSTTNQMQYESFDSITGDRKIFNGIDVDSVTVDIFTKTLNSNASIKLSNTGFIQFSYKSKDDANSTSITINDIVDRITALEQALAEKANTTNPTFTGKVSINTES